MSDYMSIPPTVLARILVRWPHLAPMVRNYQAAIGGPHEPAIGKALADAVCRGEVSWIAPLELWRLSRCTLGVQGGGYMP